MPAVPSALRITLDGSSPLEQALECYQRKLPLMVWRRFLSLLQLLDGFLRDSGEMDVIAGSVMLPFATACSGTDIGIVAGCVFLKWLQAKCGLAWALEHTTYTTTTNHQPPTSNHQPATTINNTN